MNLPGQLAKHLRQAYFGGNWTDSSLKENLVGITWQQATTQVQSFNTIAALVYHMNYYTTAALKVLSGGPLDAKDIYSFDHPPISSQDDWEKMLERVWADAENLSKLIEQLPETRIWENFVDEKYGSYYTNIQGTIEHFHYHLGQIVLIKKFLLEGNES